MFLLNNIEHLKCPNSKETLPLLSNDGALEQHHSHVHDIIMNRSQILLRIKASSVSGA